jgi:hypothetical protein
LQSAQIFPLLDSLIGKSRLVNPLGVMRHHFERLASHGGDLGGGAVKLEQRCRR